MTVAPIVCAVETGRNTLVCRTDHRPRGPDRPEAAPILRGARRLRWASLHPDVVRLAVADLLARGARVWRPGAVQRRAVPALRPDPAHTHALLRASLGGDGRCPRERPAHVRPAPDDRSPRLR